MFKRHQRFNTSPSPDIVQYVGKICSRLPTQCMPGSNETIFGIVAGFPESQESLVWKTDERPRKVSTKMQPNCEITRYSRQLQLEDFGRLRSGGLLYSSTLILSFLVSCLEFIFNITFFLSFQSRFTAIISDIC